ncbi:MAG: hypothetical protein AB202_02065 [Parcubacteria bacterium C7867-007]|nr:MAG: hypothetical protein AB202_02065 [Parcubacteria bacterium C7867-007]
MIKFVLVVPDPEGSDRYLTKDYSWPVLPRVGDTIFLKGIIGWLVEAIAHHLEFDEENPHIEVTIGVGVEEFEFLSEQDGWLKNDFD